MDATCHLFQPDSKLGGEDRVLEPSGGCVRGPCCSALRRIPAPGLGFLPCRRKRRCHFQSSCECRRIPNRVRGLTDGEMSVRGAGSGSTSDLSEPTDPEDGLMKEHLPQRSLDEFPLVVPARISCLQGLVLSWSPGGR